MPELYVDGIDDLVTGEAVTLDLPPAPLGVHIVSALIDVVLAIGVLIGGVLLTSLLAVDDATAAVGGTLTIVTALLILPTAVETLSQGRSLGKLIMGLRTVRDDAGPIVFRHAFVRSLLGAVEIWALQGVPAFISGLVSRKGKRIGDYAAGTYVIRSRVKLALPPPAAMPHQLAGWAKGADIAPIPEGLLLSVRQLLGRGATLAPETRMALTHRLAGELTRYVSPGPPPGTPPEHFLAAVIAEHRDRDFARIQRETALVRRLTEASRRSD